MNVVVPTKILDAFDALAYLKESGFSFFPIFQYYSHFLPQTIFYWDIPKVTFLQKLPVNAPQKCFKILKWIAF